MRYDKMSTAELKNAAWFDGIKDYDKMSKEELINKLKNAAWFDGIKDYDKMSKEELINKLEGLNYCGYMDNICDLRDEARKRGISGYLEMTKVELIHQLNTVIEYIYQPTPESVPRNVKVVHCPSWMGDVGSRNDKVDLEYPKELDDNDSIGSLFASDDDDDNDSIGSLFASDSDDDDE